MKKRKRRTVKTIIYKGEKIDYQWMIESVFGDLVNSLSCYYEDETTNKGYILPDCDLEIIIKPKK